MMEYDPDPSKDKVAVLQLGIDTYAQEKRDLPPYACFGFFIYDGPNIVAGARATTYYGCTHIEELWVDKALRGQNYGTQLLQAVEKQAKENGCLFMTLETMDWEAKDFYLKFGYEIEYVREGYPQDIKLYSMRKNF